MKAKDITLILGKNERIVDVEVKKEDKVNKMGDNLKIRLNNFNSEQINKFMERANRHTGNSVTDDNFDWNLLSTDLKNLFKHLEDEERELFSEIYNIIHNGNYTEEQKERVKDGCRDVANMAFLIHEAVS